MNTVILSKCLNRFHSDGSNFACVPNVFTILSVIETLWHGLCFNMLDHKTDIHMECHIKFSSGSYKIRCYKPMMGNILVIRLYELQTVLCTHEQFVSHLRDVVTLYGTTPR